MQDERVLVRGSDCDPAGDLLDVGATRLAQLHSKNASVLLAHEALWEICVSRGAWSAERIHTQDQIIRFPRLPTAVASGNAGVWERPGPIRTSRYYR